MKKWIMVGILALTLAGCGGGEPNGSASQATGAQPATGGQEAGEPVGPQTDPETGYVINPSIDVAQSGEPFIAIGEVTSMNLTPRTSPEYLILADDSNVRYRVLGQSVEETYYTDGTLVPLQSFQIGLRVRATVMFDAGAQPVGRYTSDDVTVLVEGE